MSTVPQDHPAAARESAAFGEFLRRERQQRGITLQDICRETKIPRAHLEALEQGNLALLPPGTYRRGEVVAYAAVVGLDRSVALAHLQSAVQPPDPRQSTAPKDRPHPVDRGWIRLRLGPRTITGFGIGAAMTVALLWAGAALTSPPLTDAVPAPAHRQPDAGHVAAASVIAAARETAAPATTPEPPSNTRPNTSLAATLGGRGKVTRSGGRDGRLVVITQPAGARVTINGVGWGVTPLALDNLPPGTKRIRVTSEGFSAAERTLELPTAGATTVRIALRARDGSGPPPRHD